MDYVMLTMLASVKSGTVIVSMYVCIKLPPSPSLVQDATESKPPKIQDPLFGDDDDDLDWLS